MARPRKKRGPGRPPGSKNKRGPGRPKGSKNKPKSVAVAGYGNVPAVLNNMRARLGELERRFVHMASIGEAEDLAEVVRSTVEQITEMHKRVEKLTTAFNDLVTDVEHPSTQILARRLIAVEQADKMTRTAHDRLNMLEQHVRQMRTEVAELVNDRITERNRAEVERIARGEEESEMLYGKRPSEIEQEQDEDHGDKREH
jgi:archaellum component FlaC